MKGLKNNLEVFLFLGKGIKNTTSVNLPVLLNSK